MADYDLTSAASGAALDALLGKADTALQSSTIGVTVQGYDADTAKLDTAQTWTGRQCFRRAPDGALNFAIRDPIALPQPLIHLPLAGNANDISGHLRHGSITDTAGFSADVRRDYALNFTTAGRCDLSAHTSEVSSLTEGSLFIRFKKTGSTVGRIVSFSNAAVASEDIALFADFPSNGKVSVQVRLNNATPAWRAEFMCSDDTWNAFCLVMDAVTGIKMYVNGSLISPTYSYGSEANTQWLSSITLTDFIIGQGHDNSAYEHPLNGYVSDFRIYSEKLTAQQIAWLSCDLVGILLAGQSNMVGRAENDGLDFSDSRVLQYKYSDNSVALAEDPLDHWDESATHIGSALSGARLLADGLPYGKKLLLIPRADGGTSFSANHWNVGDTHYTEMVSACNEVIALGGCIIGCWWHQGESDADTIAGRDAYQAAFDTMICSLRNAINDDCFGSHVEMPFVCGTLRSYLSSSYRADVNVIISGTSKRLPNVSVCDLAALSVINDNTHFTASSLRDMGVIYATAFSRLFERK